MRLRIDHTTHYGYGEEVRHSVQYLRLTPQDLPNQQVLHWELELPAPAWESVDVYGNIQHLLSLDTAHTEIRLHARGEVEIRGEDVAADESIPVAVFLRQTPLTTPSPAIRAFAEELRTDPVRRNTLVALMEALEERVTYVPGATRVDSTAAEAFEARSGVCQDHAHIFLACLRHLGIPARYVSGYFLTDDDAHVASHAWVEAWIEGRWRTFDVTNRLDKPSHHLKLAVGMDYLDACPVRGVRFGGGEETMHAFAFVSLRDDEPSTPSQ